MTIIAHAEPTLIHTLWPAAGSARARAVLLVALGSLFLAVCAQIYIPREPVRTISTSLPRVSAALKKARATSSAPTQSAPESRDI